MAAPNSAQTRPSHMAKIAPRIQPSIACGPPIAVTISGMVMNGPTPIMSIMLSAVALLRPTPRIRAGDAGLLPGLDGVCIVETSRAGVLAGFCVTCSVSAYFMTGAQQVYVQPNRSRYPRWQLTEESVSRVNVRPLAILRAQQPTLLRWFSGIVASEQRLELDRKSVV